MRKRDFTPGELVRAAIRESDPEVRAMLSQAAADRLRLERLSAVIVTLIAAVGVKG